MLKNIVLKKPYNLFFFLSFLTFNFSFGQITEIDLQLAQKYFIDQDYEKAHLYYEKIAKEPQYLSKIYKNYKSTLKEWLIPLHNELTLNDKPLPLDSLDVVEKNLIGTVNLIR